MTDHKFTPATGAKSKCAECGKTRNAVIHKNLPKADPGTAAFSGLLPGSVAPKPTRKAAPKPVVDEPTVRLWVGWRIANAVVLQDPSDPAMASLITKVREAKPD